jgi:hypothetical protein
LVGLPKGTIRPFLVGLPTGLWKGLWKGVTTATEGPGIKWGPRVRVGTEVDPSSGRRCGSGLVVGLRERGRRLSLRSHAVRAQARERIITPASKTSCGHLGAGARVGGRVGARENVGDCELGALLGKAVGDRVGEGVTGDLVGKAVGDRVGERVVGDLVGENVRPMAWPLLKRSEGSSLLLS